MQTFIHFGLVDVIGKRYVEDCYMTVDNGLIQQVGPVAELREEQKRERWT